MEFLVEVRSASFAKGVFILLQGSSATAKSQFEEWEKNIIYLFALSLWNTSVARFNVVDIYLLHMMVNSLDIWYLHYYKTRS